MAKYSRVGNGKAPEYCTLEGCGNKHWAKGFCGTHYRMNRLYGDPRGMGRSDPEKIRQRRTEFYWTNVDKQAGGECWQWLRKPTPQGYGQLRWLTGRKHAHQVAYELAYGALPVGTEIDHLCHTPECRPEKASKCPHRLCCNPAHLKATARAENVRRGNRWR